MNQADNSSTTAQSGPSVDQLIAQITARFGSCPAFFLSARDSPEVLASLWQQAQTGYLDNPLPSFFKDKLFAYLSRYCESPYCVAQHAAWLTLRDRGREELDPDDGSDGEGMSEPMSAAEVVAILQRPRPSSKHLRRCVDALARCESPLTDWPLAGSELDEHLYACAVAIFLQDEMTEPCQAALRQLLGATWYARLMLFLAFVRTAHFWTNTQPPLELDSSVQQILNSNMELAAWLSGYRAEVETEHNNRSPINRALAREKKLFESVVRSIPDALILADLNRTITFCNQGVESVFGYAPEELVGQPASLIYADPSDYEKLGSVRFRPDADEQYSTVEICMRHRSGESFPGELVGTILKSTDGQPFGFLGLIRDVTLRKQAEADLRRYNRVLEALTTGMPLDGLLELVVRLVEEARPGMFGSVLLIDETKQILQHVYRGRLDEAFGAGLDQVRVGDEESPCGTAASIRQRVIVEDIAAQPDWEQFRILANEAGVRASWSEPIRSAKDEIQGIFAVHFREPKSPSPADLNLLRHSAQLAEMVIDRAHNNERLRESEQRYRSVVLASSSIVSTADRRGEFVTPQYSWKDYTGQPWEEQQGWGWSRMLHPDDAGPAARAWRNLLRSPSFFMMRFRLWHAASSEYRYVEGRAVPIVGDDGSVCQWVGTTDDVHDRALAEEKLRQREHEFRMLADNVPELFCYTDAQQRFRFVNRRYEEVHHRPRSEFIGLHLCELLGQPTYERAMRRHFEAALLGRRVTFEDQIPAASNPHRWVSVVLIPDTDPVGRVCGVYAMESDITERRALEKQVLDVSTEEARRIGNDLHDGIGQELTGLSMIADTLVTALSRKSMPETNIAEKIKVGVKRSLGQIRSLARGMNPVDVDAQGLMSALSEMSHRMKNLYNVECCFECEQPVLLRDNQIATQLYRIAQEATTNAVKHGRSTRIVISLRRVNQRATMRVVDNGVGMPSECDVSQGMGLRIMKYRAGIIGGNLQIHSAAGGGTDVVCSLSADALRNYSSEESGHGQNPDR